MEVFPPDILDGLMPQASPPLEPLALDKSSRAIRDMFAAVAPRYDLLNRLLSGWLDEGWRRQAVSALNLPAGAEVLDLCCGTGDQSRALSRRGARVVAADFCLPMLAIAQHKLPGRNGNSPRIATADALALPFVSERFQAATVSFGLRNVADLHAALVELRRVLKPGGRLAVLEPTLPENRLIRGPYVLYFTRVLPRIGALLSPRGSAYSYLPSSVLSFPERQSFLDRLAEAGFENNRWVNLTAGTVCLYLGSKPS